MRCTARMHASPRSLHVHKQRISPRHTNIASPTALEHIPSSNDKMPRNKAKEDARVKWRGATHRAARRAMAEAGSNSSAEEAGMFNCSEYLALN
jgi:hypothetical protein